MGIDPLKWLEIGKTDRTTPLGKMEWSASFYKLAFLIMVFLWMCTIAYTEGKSVSISDVRSVVAAEVAAQLADKLTPVTAALAAIQADQQAMAMDAKKRDKVIEQIAGQRGKGAKH